MIKKILTLTLLVIITGIAQAGQVLVKGVVTDAATGKPLGVTIDIYGPSDKRINTKSNSLDGKYEQLLEGGATYRFIFQSFDILRTEKNIEVKDNGSFAEQEENIKVKKIAKGDIIKEYNIFTDGTSDFVPGYENYMRELQEMLRFNRSLNLDLVVSAGGNDTLRTRRLEMLSKYVAEDRAWRRYKKKVSVSEKLTGTPPKSDLQIIVTKVEDILNR